ncbi:cysteine proteinase [Hypoxylon sp. EC38]|nr:cysteine proteinase [Hypoxylon sp. EC38]
MVPEYQIIRKYTRPTPRKRARYDQTNETTNDLAFLDPDIDSDGDVQVVEDPKPMATSQKFKQPQKESLQPISEMARRFGGGGYKATANNPRQTAAAMQFNKAISKTEWKDDKRKSADSSPDELALETPDFKGKVSNKRPVTPSPSLSKRGDIQRTKFSASSHTQGTQETIGESDMERAKTIIGSRLRIRRAVSGSYKYEAEKASSADECFLKLIDVSFILHPANLNNDILKQYAYCTINLNKISSILVSSDPNRCIVSIARSTDATISGGPKLLVEFLSPEDLEHFKKWAKMDLESVKRRDILVEARNPDELEKQLTHMIALAPRTTTITDNEPRGDDIKLMEHNAAVRGSRQAQSSSRSYVSNTQVKLKDSMRSQILPSLSNSKPTAISHNPRPYDTQRPARTTRSTFALKSPDLEFKSQEPVGWTTKNKGWEKNWRNSLVFPPQGKSRATVDKEDIPRLDEGEFLNDNLLIFYLRYLQHSLEAKRPDLAQRIYFQNTFFYERLRSSRTNQGINYESVRAWTSKVDLFTKDYIIVPINECSHWYVAIIYNAPKLLPSSNKIEAFGDSSKDSINIEENADDSGPFPSPSPHNKSSSKPMSAESVASAVQNDVISHLSQKQKGDMQSSGYEQDVEVVRDMDDSKAEAEQIVPSNSSLQQKKAKKKQSPRKHSPNQPRIITLDSLGISHSPACICLKQYLIAELKDKKGIEIPNPGALGMTARHLPEQSNHCDCGLYLLGYIQEFLKDPDSFVRNLLQYNKDIAWDFDPSRLRCEIRDLIFQLQREQQDREDAQKEGKRKGGLLKRKKTGPEHQSLEPNELPAKEQVTNQDLSEPLKDRTEETVVTPESKSPTPKIPGPETRPTSDSEESRDIPGAFPRTPVVKSPGAMGPSVMAGDDNGKRMETPRITEAAKTGRCSRS